MLRIGLTGSIGMGKSTTARMFAEEGVPIHDADAAVHRLYAGRAAPLVEAAFPGTTAKGAVDRSRLREAVVGRPEAMAALERLIHPLVAEEEAAAIAAARRRNARAIVLDVPLLLETDAWRRVDLVVVVSAPAAVQRARVLARPGMTEAAFAAILARQLPDAEKRRRAHFVVDSGRGHSPALADVRSILRATAGLTGGA